jgi:hypothetical protein
MQSKGKRRVVANVGTLIPVEKKINPTTQRKMEEPLLDFVICPFRKNERFFLFPSFNTVDIQMTKTQNVDIQIT